MSNSGIVEQESSRIRAEYVRRAREVSSDRYAPWQPAVLLEWSERIRVAARLLKRLGRFPAAGQACLEIGCGSSGWLPDLVRWGIDERSLYGVELDPSRAAAARRLLPQADIRPGNAVCLPWASQAFHLTVLSTVLSSVLNNEVRRAIAQEAMRVTHLSGAVLCYDLGVNNPRNANVRRVTTADLRALFPGMNLVSRRVTLAPPLARLIAPRCWVAAQVLESLRVLTTHRLTILTRAGS